MTGFAEFVKAKQTSQPKSGFAQFVLNKNSEPSPVIAQRRPNPISTGVKQGLEQAGQSAIGTGKGMLSTLNSVSKLGQSVLSQTAGRFANLFSGKGFKPTEITPDTNRATPTPAQRPAFVGEQLGEFFLPSSAVSKVSSLPQITKLGPLAKSGAKAVIEGAAAGGVRLAQTAKPKEAIKAGVTAGALAGTANIAGEVLRKARIPEWFYSKIFRTSSDDMLQELKSVGTVNIQKTNPELYDQLVKTGAIKLNGGKVVLNETLAKEAIDRGLKGSIKTMANEVVKDTYKAEASAQKLVASHTKPVKVETQYTKLLKEVSQDYKDVGFGEISKKADDILVKIKNGQTDANTALELRRFLDGMRTRASFNPTTKLTQTQGNFKTLADTMRQRLAKEVKGLDPVMNEYRFNIEALDSLAKEAARRGNREVIGLLDTVFFGSGMVTGNPALGASLGIARRLLNSPAGSTYAGSALNNLGSGSSKLGRLLKGSAAYGSSKGSQPTQGN